jgi:DNA-directed RNA polymerase alpha subunit
MSIIQNYENNHKLYFTLANSDVSIANAIRRTILSDIPTVVIRTEDSKVNQCNIQINTSRFHNELVKQRLSCIPIHTNDPEFTNRYILEVDVKNESVNELRWVTTNDFKIKDKNNDQYLSEDETRKIFPPNPKTLCYIDFLRLRSSIGNSIPGEHIKLSATFSVASAKTNSMFNVVSTCTYQNSPDKIRVDEAWQTYKQQLESEQRKDTEIEFEKKNFYFLQAERYYINNAGQATQFDFTIQTIGVYTNKGIVFEACKILCEKCKMFVQGIDADTVPRFPSLTTRENGYLSVTESTIEYSFDIILENEDYTLGKVLEYLLYEHYYKGEEILSYCGFKKYHPHDEYSVIRIAYKEAPSVLLIKSNLTKIGNEAYQIFHTIQKLFL